MKIKNKKIKRITEISLGTIVGITSPLALAYTINAFRGQGPKENLVIETPSKLLKNSLTPDEIKDKIFDGKILDLSVEDLMKIIRALKSDEESEIKSLVLFVYPKIIDYVKKIENSTFRFIFEIILNKGIYNISDEEISKIEKVIKTFVTIPDKWASYIKYISPFINKGLNAILFANDNELINKFLPQITNYIVKKLVKKSKNENATQKAARIKKEQEIETDIRNIIRKLLIDGYKQGDENTAIRQMAIDITNLVYKLTDKIPKDFAGGLIKTKPIVEDIIFYLIDSIFSPVRTRIDNKRNDIDKQINILKANIKNTKVQNLELSQLIKDIDNSEVLLSKEQYDLKKAQVNAFKSSNRYDYLMYELDIKNEDLEYVKNNYVSRIEEKKWSWSNLEYIYSWKTKTISEYEWYQKEYNAYYLFAISLWHSEHSNKIFKSINAWNAEVKQKWIEGANNKINLLFVKLDNPNHKPLDNLIKNAYGLEVLDSLKSKYAKIKNNLDLIKSNKDKSLILPINFDKNDIFQLDIYESKQKTKIKIQKNEQKISDNEQKIIDLGEEAINLLRSRIYQFEVNNNLTKKVLMKNGLLNGKGLLKLSTKDLGNFLYKVQDLIANLEIYLDIVIDKTIKNNPLISAASFFLKFGGFDVKDEIKSLVLPIIRENLDPDLVLKIQTVSTENVTQVVRGILDQGLLGINDQTIITSTNILQKFAPSVDLILEKRTFSNILKILKNGLKFLPRALQVTTIHEIINAIPMSPSIKSIIKGYIQ